MESTARFCKALGPFLAFVELFRAAHALTPSVKFTKACPVFPQFLNDILYCLRICRLGFTLWPILQICRSRFGSGEHLHRVS